MSTTILIQNIGKKFNKEWIFRGINSEIVSGQKLVILGGNGSGKSTLLQVISGFVSANEGKIIYKNNGSEIAAEKIKDHISFASPYIQLVEDFTLLEMVEHVRLLKKFKGDLSVNEFIDLIDLRSSAHKSIKQFSSGMKQRLKLGLAILADTPVLLLDEPVSNLDKKAIDWYKELIANHTENRTVIVCSNAITEEYAFCDTKLDVMDFKTDAKNSKTPENLK